MSALRKLIESTAPHRPWCGEAKHAAKVRPLSTAIELPYLQLNPPSLAVWLQFDIDRPDAAHAWEDARLPAPTYVAINKENGHAQYGYALAAPVCTADAARKKPLLYLAALEYAYNRRLSADLAFNGPLAKNPIHPMWTVWQPANDATYELTELAEYVQLPSIAEVRQGRIDTDYAMLGRNCLLFEQLRMVCYKDVKRFWRPGGFEHFRGYTLDLCQVLNAQFTPPLPFGEIKSIARSVAKWIWDKFSPADFRAIQATRGRRKGASTRDALLPDVLRMHREGKSQREIASAIGESQQTVGNWLRRAE